MKLLSLFDGSGGFPLAASMCGIEPVYASEVEPYPIAVTRSRFPNMVHLGDVSKVHGWDLDPVDVITFGSPCQDMSIAGKRAGIKHEGNGDEETTRSGLFMEAVRIIKEMREATHGIYPDFAVWENVPGAFSSNKGEDFRTVLKELVQIVEPGSDVPPVPKAGWSYYDCWVGDGWSLAYRTFDAQYWGVPQRRRRIYLVLDLRGRRAGKVLFERQGLQGRFEAGGSSRESVAGDTGNCAEAADRAREEGCMTPWDYQSKRIYMCDRQKSCAAGFKHKQGVDAGIGWEIEKAPTLLAESQCAVCYAIENHPADSRVKIEKSGKVQTLTSRMGTGGGNIPLVLKKEVFRKGTRPHSKEEAQKWEEASIANTLNTFDVGEGRANELVCYCMAHGQSNAEVMVDKSPTLNCNHEQPILYAAYIVRRLTPTECARLQGFPDRWGDIDPLDVSDESELELWREVYKVYCQINGVKVSASILSKPDRLKAWHDKLLTDSAEYKMWGNGIALPNALYVMQGIEEAINCYG